MTSHRDRLAREVRAEMARHNMTRTQLADRIGMSAKTLDSRMHGKYSFTVDELTKIADVFGVTVTTFMSRADEPKEVA